MHFLSIALSMVVAVQLTVVAAADPLLQDAPPQQQQQQGGSAGATEQEKEQEAGEADEAAAEEAPADPQAKVIATLQKQMLELQAQMQALRQELATVTMERDEAARERDELRQFLRDHREYGDDFAQYQEIRELTRQTERRRAAEEARQRREEERQRRLAERNLERGLDEATLAEREKLEKYSEAGFQPLGLDVFLGRTGFFYGVKEQAGVRVEYEPIIGHFLEPTAPTTRIDYSEMTISGTVLNASDEVRNIGIAIAFFDRRGNQVGSETVQISNARPNVPYPFTSTIEMALGEPFASSTSWVLYADAVSNVP